MVAIHKKSLFGLQHYQSNCDEDHRSTETKLQMDWYKKPDVKVRVMLVVKRVLMKKEFGIN